jgi:hypothetical protein
MNTFKPVRSFVLLITFVLASLVTSQAFAGSVTLNLNRVSLTNVPDAAGTWQHEGGTISKGATVIGNYAAHRRVTTGGTIAQNTAMETMTLFFTVATAAPAPQNITLEGAHSFNTGGFMGSVSASSDRYAWIRGASATVTAATSLTITWLGGALTLP